MPKFVSKVQGQKGAGIPNGTNFFHKKKFRPVLTWLLSGAAVRYDLNIFDVSFADARLVK